MKVLYELVNPQDYKKYGPSVLCSWMVAVEQKMAEVRHDFNIASATGNNKLMELHASRLNMLQKNIMFMDIQMNVIMARQVQQVKLLGQDAAVFNN